jgi:hypothetical protein
MTLDSMSTSISGGNTMITINYLDGWARKRETMKIEVVQKDLCIVDLGGLKLYMQNVQRRFGADEIEITGTAAKRNDQIVDAPFSARITKDSITVSTRALPFGVWQKTYEFPEGQERVFNFTRLKAELSIWAIDK